MRVLFYSTYFYPYISGMTVYPLNILTPLAKHYEITVLTYRTHPHLVRQETYRQLRIHRLAPLARVSKGYIPSPGNIVSYIRHVHNSDAVILNLPNAEGLLLALLARLMRKQLIGLYLCEVDLGPGLIKALIVMLLNLSVRIQMALCTHIITSEDYISQFPTKVARYQNKLVYTPPSATYHTAPAEARRRMRATRSGRHWIGFVGRVSSEKGIEYLIEACAQLQKDLNIELVFVGPSGPTVAGEGSYFRKIVDSMDRAGLRYRLLGVLSDEDLAAFYETIDVLVLPSTNKTESFGIVQAEAMMHAAPVVASSIAGVRIPINTTGMGILVRPRSSSAIETAIRTIMNNRTYYTSASKVRLARQSFGPEKSIMLLRRLLIHRPFANT